MAVLPLQVALSTVCVDSHLVVLRRNSEIEPLFLVSQSNLIRGMAPTSASRSTNTVSRVYTTQRPCQRSDSLFVFVVRSFLLRFRFPYFHLFLFLFLFCLVIIVVKEIIVCLCFCSLLFLIAARSLAFRCSFFTSSISGFFPFDGISDAFDDIGTEVESWCRVDGPFSV